MTEVKNENSEIGVAGNQVPREDETLNFSFEVKEEQSFFFVPKETGDGVATLRVWRGDRSIDIRVHRLAMPFVREAGKAVLEEFRQNPGHRKNLDTFRKIFCEKLSTIFEERMSEAKIFEGKRGVKIRIELRVVYCLKEKVIYVKLRATDLNNEGVPFWVFCRRSNFDEAKKNYEMAKQIFHLLTLFCESVRRPTVRQVKKFAKGLVVAKKREWGIDLAG